MKYSTKPLPDDLGVLKAMVLKLQSELATEQAKNKHLSDYISQLIEAIKLAKHQHFGARSEKPNGEQLSLPFNETEALADHNVNNMRCQTHLTTFQEPVIYTNSRPDNRQGNRA